MLSQGQTERIMGEVDCERQPIKVLERKRGTDRPQRKTACGFRLSSHTPTL